MTTNMMIQMAIYVAVLVAFVKPLGAYMAKVYMGEPFALGRVLGPVERLIYKVCLVKSDEEMTWQRYAASLLWFSLFGVLAVYLIQRMQSFLPLNPAAMAAVSPDSSFNTAISFVTNTNWQGYGGESTMSYLTQMAALGVQNFLSAASAMAVMVALIRGITRHTSKTIGNFWVDLTRSTVYILLPLSIIFALVLVSQGVVQNFSDYKKVQMVETVTYDNPKNDDQGNPIKDASGNPVTEKATLKEQTIPMGPAASQIAIKQLGTNGGGYFNVNSAHPFENPTALSNFLEMLAILLIGAALCYTFGRMVNDKRQGWALLAAMLIIFIPLLLFTGYIEQQGNPQFSSIASIDQSANAMQSGGNMEGKEVRFGIASSATWAVATTSASNGSVNSMHDSYTPLGGLVPMFLMQLGEVVFGGLGCGLYGMLMFVLLTVFIAGLMVGRTPEYLGKKIESFEMKMASLTILIPAALTLVGTAIASIAEAGVAGVANPGPHGFSEILYAFSSATGNNGSAFAGLSANTVFYNSILGFVMFMSRFGVIIPVLGIAGSLAAKKYVPASSGTLPTHTPLFVTFLVAVIIIIGALTFLPSLALGPIAEQMLAGIGR